MLATVRSAAKRLRLVANVYLRYLSAGSLVSYSRHLVSMAFPTTPALTSLAIDSSVPLAVQLNDVYACVEAKLSGNECPELADNCRRLFAGAGRVVSFASEYDFEAHTPANGYWTFVRLVIKFGKAILVSYRRGQTNDTLLPVSEVLIAGLSLCEQFRARAVCFVEADADQSATLDSETPNENLFSSKPTEFVGLLDLFKTLAPQLDVLYGHYNAFWLCPSMRRAMYGFSTLMAMYSFSSPSVGNLWLSTRNLWDRSHRAHTVANIAQNATVEFVKSFWGLTELGLVRNTLQSVILVNQPKVIREVHIGRQRKWRISATEAKVIDTESEPQFTNSTDHPVLDSKIRCKLLRKEFDANSPPDSAVLHLHGGGFVAQSPDSHEVYLRDWASKLSGIPILSVDYSLSPEYKYPIALQEVLDCYLWLISDDRSVEQTLGFKPSRVIVCGDSAGGNLSAALCLVLNDIRKSLSTSDCSDKSISNFRVPAAILCFYTPFMLLTLPSPSRILTAVDTLLPLGVLLSCLEAYVPFTDEASDAMVDTRPTIPVSIPSPANELSGASERELDDDSSQAYDYGSLHFLKPFDCDAIDESITPDKSETNAVNSMAANDDDFVHISYNDVPPKEDLRFDYAHDMTRTLQGKYCRTFRKLKNKIIGTPATTVTIANAMPWYRRSPVRLNEKLKRLNGVAANAYISPYLASPGFEFDDIPIFIVALNYDACLDDSVEMAKKWRGPVVLDILDELPHGFLNFVLLSEEAKRGSELCLSRIKQALGVL